MEFDENVQKFGEIFAPGILDETKAVADENKRFAYYTSADTAIKVLKNQELWFRNAAVMNDFSEISYGLELLDGTISGSIGEEFRNAVDDIFEGTIERVSNFLVNWETDWERETYIACISLHEDTEDQSGRLSMWRAYGDTAIIVKNTPMIAVTDLLGVYSTPVMYLSREGYKERLSEITYAICCNRKYLRGLGQDALVDHIQLMFSMIAVSSKHPGFAEEKEWRLFYRPNQQKSDEMKPRTVILNGVPQIIYALQLGDDQKRGLHGADIPSLLDRIIVGPTEHPYVSVMAFRRILEELEVKDVDSKVIASDIPLRSG